MQKSYDSEKEFQASECLRVGAAERGLLLALSVKLAGNAEDGEDLYQQSLLDCHDAIQKKGFTGSNYKFYILQAIKWGNVERQRAAGKLTGLEAAESFDQSLAPAPTDDSLAALAAEVEQELESRYPPRWVRAFRLHVAGKSYREIEALMTPRRDFSCIQRKIIRMKNSLRQTFGQAWVNIDAE